MSDSNPQRNAWGGIPQQHPMNTSNNNQPNSSSGVSHGPRHNTRSQVALPATAGSVDRSRTPTEIHQGSTYGYSSTTRTPAQVRHEEERHEGSYSNPTSNSKKSARDKQYQEGPPRTSASGARDKAPTTELPDSRRNLRKRIQI